MATIIYFHCTRPNESGGPPANYACTLELTDDAIFGSSGTWKLGGPSPTKIFVAQSGKWAKTVGQVTLDSISGAIGERVIMQNPDAGTGVLKGNGLVGGYIVNWTKT
jgi:hypothetical protein